MQMRSISSLEDERTVLRKQIAAASPSGGGAGGRPTGRSVEGKTGGGKGNIDWKALAAQLASEQEGGGVGDSRAMMRIEKMSDDEMLAALDEIAGLELSPEDRTVLESMIIDPLIEKNPELALMHLGDRIQSDPDGVGWQLSSALKQWAKGDLGAATAWFDKQIADGTFDSKSLDGRSEMRLQFEGALLESLLGTDPEAASRRIAAIPEDQRREILQQLSFDELSPTERNSYTAMIRNLVPEDEREGSFAYIASELVTDGGFSEVSTFLDGVNASPQEREAAAKDVANSRMEQLAQDGTVTAKDVDSMREWLTRQAPGEVDAITGKALGEAAQERGKFKFSDASELVLKYYQSSGNDDVLVGFLESFSAHSNLETARHLAGMITDETRRNEILENLK